MTVDVGNSLYKYILNGRPKVISDYVFLNHRVPYDSGWFGYNRNNTAYSLGSLASENNLTYITALIKGTYEVPFTFKTCNYALETRVLSMPLFWVKPTCATSNHLPTSLI